jgi:hypothetical protein
VDIPDVKQNATDYVVSTAKAVLGMVPFAGSLLAELAGTIIPRQRLDRLSDFASRLETKVNDLDKAAVISKLADENFTDLLEETIRFAVTAVTEDRREYLATLLAAGIAEDRVSYIETKHLLRILGQINDIEVVWLRYYSFPLVQGDEVFRNRHAKTIETVIVTLGSDGIAIDKQALQRNYVQHLVSLGLLERPMIVDLATGLPQFDISTGAWKTRSHQVTPLGRLLLRHIGLNIPDKQSDA